MAAAYALDDSGSAAAGDCAGAGNCLAWPGVTTKVSGAGIENSGVAKGPRSLGKFCCKVARECGQSLSCKRAKWRATGGVECAADSFTAIQIRSSVNRR